jgi:AraC-like DNA-binding protein
MNSEQLKIFYPKNVLLQRHIDYYYFLDTDADDFCSTYYSFPNTVYSLNIHKSASCNINGYAVCVKHDPANDYLCILQGKYDHPIKVKLEGRLDKVTIGFKPLGLNHFIKTPLNDIAVKPAQIFSSWDSLHFLNFLNTFYQTNEHANRIEALEAFLLTQYAPLAGEHILEQAVKMLTDFQQEHTLAEIAHLLSLNERTLNRLFHKHFAISPVTYRQIARFRHSLKNKLTSEDHSSLTQISYKSNFYDQSYFIKAYRKFAGDSPSVFFNAIALMADDH